MIENENKQNMEMDKMDVTNWEEKYVRLYAEFENYKKRTKAEKEQLVKTANEKTLLEIIEILDDFNRFENFTDNEFQTSKNSLSNVLNKFEEKKELNYDVSEDTIHVYKSILNKIEGLKGLNLLKNKFNTKLEKMGLKELNPLNEQFDNELHEAITTINNPNYENNQIIEVLEKGYILFDKVIRYPKVIVNITK